MRPAPSLRLHLLSRDEAGAPSVDLRSLLREPPHRRRRIRCPRCAWEPRAESRWFCGCGHAWNTFETAALCPSCGKQWEVTQCLRCQAFSPHRDWYEDGETGGPDA